MRGFLVSGNFSQDFLCVFPKEFPTNSEKFSRYQRLLESDPILSDNFVAVMGAYAGPTWQRLVRYWPAILSLLDQECPSWRVQAPIAPHTDRLIADLINS